MLVGTRSTGVTTTIRRGSRSTCAAASAPGAVADSGGSSSIPRSNAAGDGISIPLNNAAPIGSGSMPHFDSTAIGTGGSSSMGHVGDGLEDEEGLYEDHLVSIFLTLYCK